MKAAENLIFQSKNRFIAVFVPGNLKDFRKTGRGGSGERACIPVCQLVKTLF